MPQLKTPQVNADNIVLCSAIRYQFWAVVYCPHHVIPYSRIAITMSSVAKELHGKEFAVNFSGCAPPISNTVAFSWLGFCGKTD